MTEQMSSLNQGETDWLLRNELATLEHAYESGEALGVSAHALLAAEINYSIHMGDPTDEQRAALETSRQAITDELSLLIPKNEKQAARKAEWLEQVPQLTPAELINYHIYRRLSTATLEDPSIKSYLEADDSPETTLEFVFGNNILQTGGYYDGPRQFESRTQAAKPTIAIERIRRAIAVGREVASSFGAKFVLSNDQTSFSVLVPGENGLEALHTLHTSEGRELARRGTAGILLALRDGLVGVVPPTVQVIPREDEEAIPLMADPERERVLRVVPDRFEQRARTGERGRVLGALLLLSGFAYGVTESTLDSSFARIEPQPIFVPGPEYVKTRDLELLRSLQRSDVIDGRFVFRGVAENRLEVIEDMLSSIIGTEVDKRFNGSAVIGKLLDCISLTPEGQLVADEQAFNAAVNEAVRNFNIIVYGTPSETISARLQRIKCLPDTPVVKASLDFIPPRAVTLHEDLEKLVTAPSLRYIGASTLEAVQRTHEALYTHNEAVAVYCLEVTRLLPDATSVAGKLDRIQEITDRFSESDPAKVRQLIRDELRRQAAILADMGTRRVGPGEMYNEGVTRYDVEYSKALDLAEGLEP